MGANPPNKILADTNWKISNGAYSSELITLEVEQSEFLHA